MHFSFMILCMITYLKYVLIVHYPHQLILLYQIIPDMVDIILFDVVSKYIFGTSLANG